MLESSLDRTIVLDSPRVTRTLGMVAAVLLLASMIGQLAKHVTGHGRLYGFVHLFYVDAEQNVPTAFSVLLLLFSATLLLLITVFKRRDADQFRWGWAILSAGFFLMASDEAFEFHERLVEPARMLTGDKRLGILYFTWVIFGIGLVGVIGFFYLRFLMHLPRRTQREFAISAALYLGGAIGFELLGGWHAETHGLESLTFSMLATAEEALELAGLIGFIRALLRYFAGEYGHASIACTTVTPGAP